MTQQERDHQTAVSWIKSDLEFLATTVGQKNASAVATSSITLAFLLRAISDDERRNYMACIDQIYATYNDSLKQGAAA